MVVVGAGTMFAQLGAKIEQNCATFGSAFATGFEQSDVMSAHAATMSSEPITPLFNSVAHPARTNVQTTKARVFMQQRLQQAPWSGKPSTA